MVLRADYKVCRPPAQLIPNLKGLSHEKPGWLIQHFHLSKAGHWTLCKSSRDLTFIPFSRDVWVLLWVLPSVTLREDILPKHQFTLNISKQNQDLTQQELWSEISEVSISQGRGEGGCYFCSYFHVHRVFVTDSNGNSRLSPYHVHNHLVFRMKEKAFSNMSSGVQIESCQLIKIWPPHPPYFFYTKV